MMNVKKKNQRMRRIKNKKYSRLSKSVQINEIVSLIRIIKFFQSNQNLIFKENHCLFA
jgi:hypothetical protein